MPSGLQTSAKTWGCGQGWRHLRDRLNCPRWSLLQQVSTPPASSPKTWLCPSTWNTMLQFSSWHLKRSFTAQISASSLIPEEKLFPLESQAAIVFSKCEMFHGWQRLEVASSSNSDDMITWERAQRHRIKIPHAGKARRKEQKSPVSVSFWALWALSGIRSTGLKAAQIFELPELLSKSLHELAPWKAADPEFFKVAWLLRCQCEWFQVLTLQVKPSYNVLYGGNTQENWLKSMVCKTRSTTPTLKSQEIHFSCKLLFPKRGSRSWREYRLGKSLLECALNSLYKDTEDSADWMHL